MRRRVEMKNIGPVKEASLDLKKFNVFIGRQGSGKSTIAKVISFCTWFEKQISRHQDLEKFSREDFIKTIEEYHRMTGYFNANSSILYFGTSINFIFNNEGLKVSWTDDRYKYEMPKVSYIPADRNIILVPEIQRVKFPDNYLSSFLFDWLDYRNSYSKDNTLSILNTDVEYYFSEDSNTNLISTKDYNLQLQNASSGLQSLTPLLLTVDYIISHFEELDKKRSYNDSRHIFNLTEILYTDLNSKVDILSEKVKDSKNKFEFIDPFYDDLYDYYNLKFKRYSSNISGAVFAFAFAFFQYKHSSFIIEEPEQNLFPSTQKDLVYKLLSYLKNSDKNHNITITTHSPYVLYAINNCILAHTVKEKLNEDAPCFDSMISPDDVSIFQIVDGEALNLQKENGLIGKNYFDDMMKETMDDFYTLMDYKD